jgi:cytochrome P450
VTLQVRREAAQVAAFRQERLYRPPDGAGGAETVQQQNQGTQRVVSSRGHVSGEEPVAPRDLARNFDPTRLSDTFFVDPYPTYRALAEFDPVHRCPDGSWFLTRYRDLDAIYRDRTHFSSDKQVAFGAKYGTGTPLYAHHTTSLVFNDPPYHTRVRRQIVGALSPQALRAMTPALESLVDGLLDAMADRPHVDLITEFAAAIPVEVIGNLLGVPHADRGPLRRWSLAILGALDPTLTPEELALGHESVTEFAAYTRELIAARRRDLRGDDDLLSRLIREDSAGEPLSENELVHNCIFLLNGTAVEECLRYESSNQLGNRLVVAPVEIGGVSFVPGDYLTLCIGAANRDAAEFTDPDRFDIGRTPNRHLAFAAGAHACAGMSVARLEAQVAIGRLVARFPRLHPAAVPVIGRRARFRGFQSLPASTE